MVESFAQRRSKTGGQTDYQEREEGRKEGASAELASASLRSGSSESLIVCWLNQGKNERTKERTEGRSQRDARRFSAASAAVRKGRRQAPSLPPSVRVLVRGTAVAAKPPQPTYSSLMEQSRSERKKRERKNAAVLSLEHWRLGIRHNYRIRTAAKGN